MKIKKSEFTILLWVAREDEIFRVNLGEAANIVGVGVLSLRRYLTDGNGSHQRERNGELITVARTRDVLIAKLNEVPNGQD